MTAWLQGFVTGASAVVIVWQVPQIRRNLREIKRLEEEERGERR